MPGPAFQRLQATLVAVKSEVSSANNLLTSSDAIDLIYEAAFLRSLVAFEKFLEDFFLEVISGSHKPKNHAISALVNFSSVAVAACFVSGGKEYADWLPYEHTARRAALFLQDGIPFSTMPDISLQVLGDAKVVRDHIAHASEHARKKFGKRLYSNLHSPQPSPASHLREQTKALQKGTKLDAYMSGLLDAALHLDPK